MLEKHVTRKGFQPFISAEKVLPEFTFTSILLGVLLAVVFGAANAYLGLKIGMTISASIPAAVISMGLVRGVLRRESILENNMVQTIGSAGESLSAGVIFTLPVLYIWANENVIFTPSLFMVTSIAVCGGVLGVMFMVPLRKALIVKEHGTLPYPEGTACAEVLLAGETGGLNAKICFTGLGVGALYKLVSGGFKFFPARIETTIAGYRNAAIGADIVPALLGVGFIIGPRIAVYMVSGAIIGWLVLIPLISNLGEMVDLVIYPATVVISDLDHWGVWDNYIRYVGAGAVAFGGISSLIKSFPLMILTLKDAMKEYSVGIGHNSYNRTNRDMSIKIVFIVSLVIIIAIAMMPVIPVGIGGALIIAVFGFIFATVSSRIVGLIGGSSNPISGMTISTLIITAIGFKMTGHDSVPGMIGTLTVGAIICIIASIAGDTSQDLKTGFLVGATPYRQQYGELLGVVASALSIGLVLTLLNQAWGFGSNELPAPQATLMKLVIEGVMRNDLPWMFVFTGVGLGLAIEFLGLPVLPIAIGLYLPIHLSIPIMIGSLVRGFLDKQQQDYEEYAQIIGMKIESGILYSSGLIAGEGLVGILLALFAVLDIDIDLGNNLGQAGSLFFFGLLVISVIKFSVFMRVVDKDSEL